MFCERLVVRSVLAQALKRRVKPRRGRRVRFMGGAGFESVVQFL
jgi:hypothetical protein